MKLLSCRCFLGILSSFKIKVKLEVFRIVRIVVILWNHLKSMKTIISNDHQWLHCSSCVSESIAFLCWPYMVINRFYSIHWRIIDKLQELRNYRQWWKYGVYELISIIEDLIFNKTFTSNEINNFITHEIEEIIIKYGLKKWKFSSWLDTLKYDLSYLNSIVLLINKLQCRKSTWNQFRTRRQSSMTK